MKADQPNNKVNLIIGSEFFTKTEKVPLINEKERRISVFFIQTLFLNKNKKIKNKTNLCLSDSAKILALLE